MSVHQSCNNALLIQIPALYRWADLATIAPSTKSRLALRSQQKAIDALRNNPDGSYAFFGPAGTGKTALMAALFRHAANNAYNKRTIWIHMADWLSDLKEFENGRTKRRPLLPRDISSGVGIPSLFIDEFDKLPNLSDFTLNNVASLLDGAYRIGAQVALTTNLTREGFATTFGANIPRRVIERCVPVDLFDKKETR
jgi:DNA replication protein DnaC